MAIRASSFGVRLHRNRQIPGNPAHGGYRAHERIKAGRYRIVFSSSKAITSARRWQVEGVVYRTLRNWVLITLYLLGVSPGQLARFYRNIT